MSIPEEPSFLESSMWHKQFVAFVREKTGCNHYQASCLLAHVIDMRTAWEQKAFGRGFNCGYDEGRGKEYEV